MIPYHDKQQNRQLTEFILLSKGGTAAVVLQQKPPSVGSSPSFTSRSAYLRMVESGQANTQACRVLRYLLNHPGSTRNEIMRALGFPINVVCGRVGDLKKAGLVYEDLTKRDKVTGLPNSQLYPVEENV